MIRLIFVVVALLMLIGAVIGGLYFWGIDPVQKFNELIGNAPAAPGEPAQVAVKPPSYVEFGLLQVPVVQDREVAKSAELILRLEVEFKNREIVAQNIPRLQSAYLQDMMEYLPVHLRGGRRLNPEIVRKRLLWLTQRTLGVDFVKDVLIEQSSVK